MGRGDSGHGDRQTWGRQGREGQEGQTPRDRGTGLTDTQRDRHPLQGTQGWQDRADRHPEGQTPRTTGQDRRTA